MVGDKFWVIGFLKMVNFFMGLLLKLGMGKKILDNNIGVIIFY